MQQGDVLLYQTNDDGDVQFEGGDLVMTSGLDTAAYLSLFGGNENDAGGSDTAAAWWGNLLETQPARQYRSETQHLLRSIPAIPANLLRIEAAARRDLAWFVTEGAAESVTVSASMPGVNRVTLEILISTGENSERLVYILNWKADAT